MLALQLKQQLFKYFVKKIRNQNGNYFHRMRSVESLSFHAISVGIWGPARIRERAFQKAALTRAGGGGVNSAPCSVCGSFLHEPWKEWGRGELLQGRGKRVLTRWLLAQRPNKTRLGMATIMIAPAPRVCPSLLQCLSILVSVVLSSCFPA